MATGEMDRKEELSIREDLSEAVRELNDSYEELSLLYRLAEALPGLGVAEICSLILEEAWRYAEAAAVAVLLYDQSSGSLRASETRGAWDRKLSSVPDDSALWRAMESGKAAIVEGRPPSGFEPPEPGLTLVCPMIGKKRVIGLLVVVRGEEQESFYSNDMKLFGAMARQAALFIENALLVRELEDFLVGTIRAFLKALEVASLWTAGHTERVTEYAVALGREMGLEDEKVERLRMCALLHDIGKIATPREILNKEWLLEGDEWLEMRRHSSVGAVILEELEKFTDISECIKYHHEHFNGENSTYGIKGDDIPLFSRILAVADAFDAITSDRPYQKRKSVSDAIAEIERKSGSQFDPRVVAPFSRLIAEKRLPAQRS